MACPTRPHGERLFDEGWVSTGDRVLGTGTIARGLALRGCHATGLDSERHLLAEAARLEREAATGVASVEGRAEETGLPAASFDVVTAGQCWHFFDRTRTTAEVARVLVPGGRLVIAHFDWLPVRDNVVAATERLIASTNPHWYFGNTTGLHSAWLTDADEGGFFTLETFSSDIDEPTATKPGAGASVRRPASAPRRRGRMSPPSTTNSRRCRGDGWPREPLIVPHRVWALEATSPARRTLPRGDRQ